MAFLINEEDELSNYYILLKTILNEGYKSNRYLEITNCLVVIPYSADRFTEFKNFKGMYMKTVGRTAESAWKRAKRVYTTQVDTIAKPSYLNRLHAFEALWDGKPIKIDQISNIVHDLAEKPRYSLLSFSIFSPLDILNRKRPGYVPCPLVGDFKFRKGTLQLNIFFRSQDALNFGYADIYFLRELQLSVLTQAKKITRFQALKDGKVGNLNLHLSRAFLPLRMEMKKRDYINKKEIDRILNNLLITLSNDNA